MCTKEAVSQCYHGDGHTAGGVGVVHPGQPMGIDLILSSFVGSMESVCVSKSDSEKFVDSSQKF